MANPFRLAGLLRFRQAQEDQAAAALARANGVHREHEQRLNRARGTLAATPANASSAAALRASAAARSASRSTLLELQALTDSAAKRAAAAQEDLMAAKKSAASLEKLDDKHQADSQQLLLREEQLFLDELAGSRALADGASESPAPGNSAASTVENGPEKV